MLLAVCVLVARASGHDDLFDQHTALDIALYKDPSQPVDVRTADLLSRMTLDEKVAQLTCVRCVCARPHACVSAPFMHCSCSRSPPRAFAPHNGHHSISAGRYTYLEYAA
jgi:hypothetical protein